MDTKVMRVLLAVCWVLEIVLLPAAGYSREIDCGYDPYRTVIQETVGMVHQPLARELARRYGLSILDLTWEDTGRYKGSSVGPNISDMTIQVQRQDPRTGNYDLFCMPVIRYANFSDKTGDVPLDKFYILVGNEKGRNLKRVTLKEFLGDIRSYLSEPGSWKGNRTSLLAPRDSHALVSAQACFLPIPEDGIAEFNPVLFNYQSTQGDPAVLTIVATREGTSVTVIDNTRDAFQAGRSWGQRLFFNQNGERASLTGQRISDFRADPQTIRRSAAADEKAGLNMVLLIQVPLKQRKPMRHLYAEYPAAYDSLGMMKEKCAESKSDVENAVIGHGKVEGPFTEIDHLAIERDPAFPIRVTVQFYKATSNGVVSDQDMREISQQIEKVYAQADYVGSLVCGGETRRPTEYTGDKIQPPHWWCEFWKRHHQNMQKSEPAPWGIVE
ncbi:MAG TPA: hypothetical protein P5110_04265 [Candidatus Omnitrophota bacterium]|nr:hypothetical protein [Candidatus Omnitrophota bacterium]HRZ14707.1 hypothetical protein [Candidatus Omnitrophota bacterium]